MQRYYYDNYNFFPHVYIPCTANDKIVGSVYTDDHFIAKQFLKNVN